MNKDITISHCVVCVHAHVKDGINRAMEIVKNFYEAESNVKYSFQLSSIHDDTQTTEGGYYVVHAQALDSVTTTYYPDKESMGDAIVNISNGLQKTTRK
jgi:hypothetical protein